MRIIGSIVVHGNKAVQSIAWDISRPLGSVSSVLKCLDRYCVDEILLIRPCRGTRGKAPFDSSVFETPIFTPLTVGGGISSYRDFEEIYRAGCERVCLSSAVIEKDRSLLNEISKTIGRQGVVAFLPIKVVDGKAFLFNSRKNGFVDFDPQVIAFCDQYCDEIVLHDVLADGLQGKFDMQILKYIDTKECGVILSGGITKENITQLADIKSIQGVAIENYLCFSEQSVTGMK